MAEINKEAQNLINEIKDIISKNYVNKDEIQKGFDNYFDLIGFPRRKVEFYENIERGIMDLNAALDTDWNAAWNEARDEILNMARNEARDAVRKNMALDETFDIDLNATLDKARDATLGTAWNIAWNIAWNMSLDVALNEALNAIQDMVFETFDDEDFLEEEAPNATFDIVIVLNAALNAVLGEVRDKTLSKARNMAQNMALNISCLNACNKNDDCKICEFRRKFCEPEYILFKNGLFTYWILKDKVIAITCPKIRHISGRLHSEFQPAIEWTDEKHYFLWGVRLEKDLWQRITDKTITFKEILELKNIEQRMVALKMMDAEKLLKKANAELLDKSERGNELYLIKGLFSRPAYFLRYTCPSSQRIYVSGVDPEIAKQNPKADFMMSWKLGITLEDYLGIKAEA